MKRTFLFICVWIFVLEVCQSSSADGELSRLLVGQWERHGGLVEYREDGTWRAGYADAEPAHGNWHIADGKLIQQDWSGSMRRSVIVWDILVLEGQTLRLRFIESNLGGAKRYDAISTFRRIPQRSTLRDGV